MIKKKGGREKFTKFQISIEIKISSLISSLIFKIIESALKKGGRGNWQNFKFRSKYSFDSNTSAYFLLMSKIDSSRNSHKGWKFEGGGGAEFINDESWIRKLGRSLFLERRRVLFKKRRDSLECAIRLIVVQRTSRASNGFHRDRASFFILRNIVLRRHHPLFFLFLLSFLQPFQPSWADEGPFPDLSAFRFFFLL